MHPGLSSSLSRSNRSVCSSACSPHYLGVCAVLSYVISSGIGDEIQEVVGKILSSSSSSSDRSEVLGHVLASLQKKDADSIFANPVDTSLVFDYLDVVTEPMDFRTMYVVLSALSHGVLSLCHIVCFVITAVRIGLWIYCMLDSRLDSAL
jgi:hypothetical protein